MSRQIDRESMSALVKLLIFCALTGLMTGVLALTLSNGSFGGQDEFKAVFTDVTGVAKGDDVRIAGVSVGSVSGVEVVQKDKALVTFGVDEGTPITQNTTATLRFRNLVGQRYMSLAQGSEGGTTRLKVGSTIPLERTQDALDLNLLLNGFKPVFEALSPEDTNKFAFEIVQTLQGESGNVETLLATTSSLTNTLAGRDKLIGDVVTNLSETLDIIGTRDTELRQTIDTLTTFVSGLKKDRNAILNSIDSIAGLTEETADLLVDGRPIIKDDIHAAPPAHQEPQQAQEPEPDRGLLADPADQADEGEQPGLERQPLQLLRLRAQDQLHRRSRGSSGLPAADSEQSAHRWPAL